jgi:site-specific DNA-methyltransferase (adenine-specific)
VTSAEEVACLDSKCPAVWLFVLPFDPTVTNRGISQEWVVALQAFAREAHCETVVAILTTPEGAATLWPEVKDLLKFQLWIAVKLKQPLHRGIGLPCQHAALLIGTKYTGSLRHNKTRIKYTYCPACDKTTKDYGGKKHTYSSYGTLMSDVWRDIDSQPSEFPKTVVERLQDLFGLSPYQDLHVVDLRGHQVLKRDLGEEPIVLDLKENAVPPNLVSTLVNGDSLEVLHRVPTNSVDFCFADPPYNLKKKYDNWNDGLDVMEYFSWCDQWLGELARVLKPQRTLAVLNIPLWAIRHFSYLRSVVSYESWIVWEGLSLPVRMIMPAHYSILCFSKGPPRVPPGIAQTGHSSQESEALHARKELYCLRQDCVRARHLSGECDMEPITDLWWDIHRLKHNSRRVDHPCQLPPALMRRLIALFTSEGECVLDPFNGAGTTTLAAEQLNRTFIGIELSQAYHDLAGRRHRALRAGDDPFGKMHKVPRAKNSNVKRLPKQHYAVAKKDLQLEVRRIAQELGRLPSRADVARLARYPIEYYEQYFISWGEVCAAARHAGMSEKRVTSSRQRSSSQPMLFDVRESM